MIFIYNDEGRVTQVMSVYPEGYLEGLPAHGMQGVQVPQEIADLDGLNALGAYYIKDGLIHDRPINPAPDEATLAVGETLEIPELPDCTVLFDDQVFEVAAGEFALEATVPGQYDLYIKCWPMRDKLVRMTVT